MCRTRFVHISDNISNNNTFHHQYQPFRWSPLVSFIPPSPPPAVITHPIVLAPPPPSCRPAHNGPWKAKLSSSSSPCYSEVPLLGTEPEQLLWTWPGLAGHKFKILRSNQNKFGKHHPGYFSLQRSNNPNIFFTAFYGFSRSSGQYYDKSDSLSWSICW